MPNRLVCATGAALALLVTGCSGGDGPAPATPSSTLITSTTKVAGAGVLGNQRRPDESCATEPARLDPGEGDRRVASGSDRGDIDVPADPQRIIALGPGQLDALCALGLQSRVVGAAFAEPAAGQDPAQPSYLGTVIHDVPGVGARNGVDVEAVRTAKPDVILGPTGQGEYDNLTSIAPTVLTDAAGAGWEETLRQVGVATGRGEAAGELVERFTDDAKQTGSDNDATHFQASVVQFTDQAVRVFGAQNFPGSVLGAVGVDRPAPQRFTDKAYNEISTDKLSDADFGDADGDIVYVSFASPAAKQHATQVMESDAWRKLSAVRDNRVFVVNNEVWQSGQGVVAARGMLDDLRWINAPIN